MQDGQTSAGADAVDQLSADARDAAAIGLFLTDRDVACPACSYNLRDATGTRCVECGTSIELTLQRNEPRRAEWLTATIAAAMGAGMGLLFVMLSLGRAGLPPPAFYPILFASFACLPTLVLLLVFRRRYCAWPRWVQRVVAWAIVFVIVGISFGLTRVR